VLAGVELKERLHRCLWVCGPPFFSASDSTLIFFFFLFLLVIARNVLPPSSLTLTNPTRVSLPPHYSLSLSLLSHPSRSPLSLSRTRSLFSTTRPALSLSLVCTTLPTLCPFHQPHSLCLDTLVEQPKDRKEATLPPRCPQKQPSLPPPLVSQQDPLLRLPRTDPKAPAMLPTLPLKD